MHNKIYAVTRESSLILFRRNFQRLIGQRLRWDRLTVS